MSTRALLLPGRAPASLALPMLVLTLLCIVVLALGSGKLTERGGRWLKLLSGVVMLALGLVMLLRPDWLA